MIHLCISVAVYQRVSVLIFLLLTTITAPSFTTDPYNCRQQGGYGGGGGYGHTGGNSGPIQRHESGPRIMPIADLNPYQNRWTIKARVTGKGEVRRWSNQRGEGYLCSIDLLDEQGGEVRGTFFKDAVDKFCDMLQVNSVYTFSGGKIKVANKQYSNIKVRVQQQCSAVQCSAVQCEVLLQMPAAVASSPANSVCVCVCFA
jgi:OB-fold nucleic acid binding domain